MTTKRDMSRDLSPAGVTAYARGSDAGSLPVVVDDVALARVAAGSAALRDARRRGEVYGLTTGVGALRHVVVAAAADDADGVTQQEADEALRSGADEPGHLQRLWRSHAAGVGPELDDVTARATMLIRLHQLLRGGSGVDRGLVEALAAALAAGGVPRLHAYGGIGTGDLTVLAELGLTLTGELPWRSAPADVAPGPARAGDALPFISSNALTAAVGCLAVTDLAALARIAEEVAALSHLALRGAAQAYDARVYAAKDDDAAALVAARMRALLGLGDHPTDDVPGRRSARLQDPFALRTLPQVHGPLAEALDAADRALRAEVGAAAENPLAAGGEALHHGHFLTQRLAATLDALRAAIYPVLALSSARTSALMDPALTGLPAFLAHGAAGSSGLMIVEYVVQDVLARVRSAVSPVTGAGAIVSLGLEEHASFSTQAAWRVRDVVALVPELLAGELVAAVRALRTEPERLVACPALELYAAAHDVLPDVRDDHVLGPDLRAAAALLRQRALGLGP